MSRWADLLPDGWEFVSLQIRRGYDGDRGRPDITVTVLDPQGTEITHTFTPPRSIIRLNTDDPALSTAFNGATT